MDSGEGTGQWGFAVRLGYVRERELGEGDTVSKVKIWIKIYS